MAKDAINGACTNSKASNQFAGNIKLQTLLFPLFFLLRYPFNWKNPIGYIAVTILQYIIAAYQFLFMGNVLAFGFGTFLLTRESIKCSTGILYKINDYAKIKKKRSKIYADFIRFIQSHSTNEQCVLIFHTHKSFLHKSNKF